MSRFSARELSHQEQ